MLTQPAAYKLTINMQSWPYIKVHRAGSLDYLKVLGEGYRNEAHGYTIENAEGTIEISVNFQQPKRES